VIDSLHLMLEELAGELRVRWESWPEKSVEYTIMMQDLSRRPPGSTPLLPPETRIGSADLKRLYDVLCNARAEYQVSFLVLYSRMNRHAKIRILKLPNKAALYQVRDGLHAYLQGALDNKGLKIVRTIDA